MQTTIQYRPPPPTLAQRRAEFRFGTQKRGPSSLDKPAGLHFWGRENMGSVIKPVVKRGGGCHKTLQTTDWFQPNNIEGAEADNLHIAHAAGGMLLVDIWPRRQNSAGGTQSVHTLHFAGGENASGLGNAYSAEASTLVQTAAGSHRLENGSRTTPPHSPSSTRLWRTVARCLARCLSSRAKRHFHCCQPGP